MVHEFKIDEQIELQASPEQVWDAIASGPGIDSWFMGRSEIEPRIGGTMRLTVGDSINEATVTAWEPAKRLAYRGDPNPDGTFMAFEYLIEGRGGGSTVLRLVHSGFLGDDWEAEYDALTNGDPMYLRKLAAYLKHFPGRTSTFNIFAVRAGVTDEAQVWAGFERTLGVTGTPKEGDRVRLTTDGTDGVVEFVDVPTYVGVSTADGIYTFMFAQGQAVVFELHSFADAATQQQIEQAWQGWLESTFA